MKIRHFIAVTFIFGFLFQARAQLTNQVAITPALSLSLLTSSSAIVTNRFSSNEEILFSVAAADGMGGGFALLPHEQTFIFNLHDSSGKLVEKTKLGILNSKSVDVSKSAIELKIRQHTVSPKEMFLNYVFVPEEYFNIIESGTYTLDIQMRVWTKRTNNQYGVVISPPLRVKIIKH